MLLEIPFRRELCRWNILKN